MSGIQSLFPLLTISNNRNVNSTSDRLVLLPGLKRHPEVTGPKLSSPPAVIVSAYQNKTSDFDLSILDPRVPVSSEHLKVTSTQPVTSMMGSFDASSGPQINQNFPEMIKKIDVGGNVALDTRRLNSPLPAGPFTLFISHQNRTPSDLKQWMVFTNPGNKPVTVTEGQLVTTTTSEAPYYDARTRPGQRIEPGIETARITSVSNNELPNIYAEKPAKPSLSKKSLVLGDLAKKAAHIAEPEEKVLKKKVLLVGRESPTEPEGIRVNGPGMATALRYMIGDNKLASKDRSFTILPGQSVVLPAADLFVNQEMMTMGRFKTDGSLHASILFTPSTVKDLKPEQAEKMSKTGSYLPLSDVDKAPTPLTATSGSLIYGRVSGISETSAAQVFLSNNDAQSKGTKKLVPVYVVSEPGEQSFLWNPKRVKHNNVKIDGAPAILSRREGSAYASHGGYGLTFNIHGRFQNVTAQPKTVSIYLDSPDSTGDPTKGESKAFRGVLKVTLTNSDGIKTVQYVEISQSQQTKGKTALVSFKINPNEAKVASIETVIPANILNMQRIRIETK